MYKKFKKLLIPRYKGHGVFCALLRVSRIYNCKRGPPQNLLTGVEIQCFVLPGVPSMFTVTICETIQRDLAINFNMQQEAIDRFPSGRILCWLL